MTPIPNGVMRLKSAPPRVGIGWFLIGKTGSTSQKAVCVKKKGYPTNTGGAINVEKRLPFHVGAALLADGDEFGKRQFCPSSVCRLKLSHDQPAAFLSL
jgi:hypothetical protein